MAAAVVEQEEQALRASLLPLTIVTSNPIDTPTPPPPQLTTPATPVESVMEAASVPPLAAPPAPQSPPPPVYISYAVQEGDTVDGLAARYGVSPSSILWSNPDLTSADSLVPGQYLRVPLSDGIIYDVRLGDTLGDIADRFGVDVQAIIDFSGNNLGSGDSIAEGQTIFVPDGRMPAPAEPTPAPLPEPPTPPPNLPPPTPLPVPPDSGPSDAGAQAAELARSRIGAPYVAGAAGPDAFDCSGLVYWVYSQVGLNVPRTSWEQSAWATAIEPSQLQLGDLVFFANTSYGGGVSHVGIYVGGGMVVMAVDDGDFVREVPLAEPYWSAHFAGAGRPP